MIKQNMAAWQYDGFTESKARLSIFINNFLPKLRENISENMNGFLNCKFLTSHQLYLA